MSDKEYIDSRVDEVKKDIDKKFDDNFRYMTIMGNISKTSQSGLNLSFFILIISFVIISFTLYKNIDSLAQERVSLYVSTETNNSIAKISKEIESMTEDKLHDFSSDLDTLSSNILAIEISKKAFVDLTKLEQEIVLKSNLSKDSLVGLTVFSYKLMVSKKYKEAEKIFLSLIDNGLMIEPIYRNLGYIYSLNSDSFNQIKIYKDAISNNIISTAIYLDLASVLFENLMIDESVDYYKMAIKFDSNSFKAYVGLADIYRGQNKIEKAIKMYNKALNIKYDIKIFDLIKELSNK